MPIELSKKKVRLNEELITSDQQVMIQQDIIVPDTKPDIGKILQVDATAAVKPSGVSDGSVNVTGSATVTALYMTDDHAVKSIMTNVPIERTFNIPQIKAGDPISCEASVDYTESNMINSRKLGVKVGISAGVTSTVQGDMDIAVEAPENFEVKRNRVAGYTTVADQCTEIPVKENIEVPTTKPSICEVLKQDIKVKNSELKVVPNKVIAKGRISINTLYTAEDGSLHFIENEIPFTEILDAEGADEGMDSEITYDILRSSFEVREDSDGDLRVLNVDILLNACLKVIKEEEIDAISDLYSTEQNCTITPKEYGINQMVANGSYPASVKDVVNIPPTQEEIAEVYNIIASPVITDAKTADNKIIVTGVIDTQILYLTNSVENPISSYQYETPFNEEIEVPGADSQSMLDVNAEMEHLSYNLGLGFDIELRFNLKFGIRVIKKVNFTGVDAVEQMEEPDEAKKSVCSIRIYFVQKNDTLWDIAKRYRTTIERLMEWNDLTESSKLYPGMQIIIPT